MMKRFASALPPLFFWLPAVLLLAACSTPPARLAVGDTAPDFLIEDLAGRAVKLSGLRGKPVVIRFFVTDCKFCRADTGVFSDYYRKHREQGLEVLYITTTVDRDQVKAFAEELKIPFPVAIDYDRKVSRAFNIKVEPQTIILGADHRIRGAILGGVGERELDELLAGLWGGATAAAPGVATPAPPAAAADTIGADARCPVCGMFVAKYEVWVTRTEEAPGRYLDFDGVKDLMAYRFNPAAYGGQALPPEGRVRVRDYYTLEWLDGRQAFYVLGSDVLGPMGHELVPFAGRAAAEAFMADHHGKKILAFAEITPELVAELRGGDPMKPAGR